MRTINKNKKAFGLNTELIVGILAIIIIALVGYFSYGFSSDSKNQYYEMAPELTYQFPAVFTHTFLMTPLTEKEKESLSLDPKEQYFVKDLILLSTPESEKLLDSKRNEYISKYAEGTDSPLSYYEKFSGNRYTASKLLCDFKEKKQIQSLEDNIKNDNYLFYMKNLNNDYVYVRFYCG